MATIHPQANINVTVDTTAKPTNTIPQKTTTTVEEPTIISTTAEPTVDTTTTTTTGETSNIKRRSEDILQSVKQAFTNAKVKASDAVHSVPTSASAVSDSTHHLAENIKLSAQSALDTTKTKLDNVVQSLPAAPHVHLPTQETLSSVKVRLGDMTTQVTASLPSRETIQPMHAASILTTRLNETKDRLVDTWETNPTMTQVRTRVADGKDKLINTLETNPTLIAVRERVNSAKDDMVNNVMKDGNPRHTKEVILQCQEAYRDMQTWYGKALLLLVVLANFFLLSLPNMILHKLGVRNNSEFRLLRVTTAPRIWIGEYIMPVGSSNCVIIHATDGSNGLFIRSPPEPTPRIIQAIRDEGEPAAFLVSEHHDTFVDKWKQLFPQAQVIAQRADAAIVENRCHVDMILEDSAEFLKKFNIIQAFSTGDWTRYEDCVLIVDMGEGTSIKLAALFGCGFMHRPPQLTSPLYWRNLFVGRQGFGIESLYAYLFVKDPKRAQEMWRQLRDMDGLDTLIFLHGEPIVGSGSEMRRIMSTVNLNRMRLGK
jgi:hypothetical protein